MLTDKVEYLYAELTAAVKVGTLKQCTELQKQINMVFSLQFYPAHI